MRRLDHIVNFLLVTATMYGGWLVSLTTWSPLAKWLVAAGLWLIFIGINIRPRWFRRPTTRLTVLAGGIELLGQFLTTLTLNVTVMLVLGIVGIAGVWDGRTWWLFLGIVSAETILFWNGILRLYLTSAQLGLLWRVMGIVCGWVPVLNLFILVRMLNRCYKEVVVESERIEVDAERRAEACCATRYPIILVHGVFFRDTPALSYWGRIPKALRKNGATLFFGEQQSATTVEDSAKELVTRIRYVMEQTGCDKVNLIAHSKGGLDSRYAISCLGMAEHVASLTTVNTPHQGVKYAVHVLDKTSPRLQKTVEKAYNNTFRHLGDDQPDFMGAILDLTPAHCRRLNEQMPDSPLVYYQSVGSWMKNAKAGRFPTNIAYPLAKKYDGDNDGLVEIESMRWGERFWRLDPPGKRGICHGDVIDLWQDNIPGFDVQEFYVQLVRDLKERGY